MAAYLYFVTFWIVFGFYYLTRDKSKDDERIKRVDLL